MRKKASISGQWRQLAPSPWSSRKSMISWRRRLVRSGPRSSTWNDESSSGERSSSGICGQCFASPSSVSHRKKLASSLRWRSRAASASAAGVSGSDLQRSASASSSPAAWSTWLGTDDAWASPAATPGVCTPGVCAPQLCWNPNVRARCSAIGVSSAASAAPAPSAASARARPRFAHGGGSVRWKPFFHDLAPRRPIAPRAPTSPSPRAPCASARSSSPSARSTRACAREAAMPCARGGGTS